MTGLTVRLARAVSAIASCSDVAPNGTRLLSASGNTRKPTVNGERSSRCVSKV